MQDLCQPRTASVQLNSLLLRSHSKYCRHHALFSAVVPPQDSMEYWSGSFSAQDLVGELRLAARPVAVALHMPQVRIQRRTPMAFQSWALPPMPFVFVDWMGSDTAIVVATVEVAVVVMFAVAVAVLLQILPWVSQGAAVGRTPVVWTKKLK